MPNLPDPLLERGILPERSRERLLGEDEPEPVAVERPDGSSPLFLTCDHAGRRVPRRLGRLGLPDEAFERHIAWDIGALAVSLRLSEAVDATLVRQRYSRLVVDCNRPEGVASAIPTISEATEIPGNAGLSEADRALRSSEILAPYHDRITALLDARRDEGRPTYLVAMHSFTPSYHGVARPWHIGTLYGRDPRLARILRDLLIQEPGLVVGDNQPYNVSDFTDYTLPVHGEQRNLPHVGIEIRQDLITEASGQAVWAERLSRLLPRMGELFAQGRIPEA
jgi:predicted N-formylglutamate amidohydrolase